MSPVPQKIPKGIINARGLVNELASESRIRLDVTNQFWQETGLFCTPFSARFLYSRENIELILEITIGRIFDSGAGQEVLDELPIPVSYSFSLEPQPLIKITGELPVTPDTKKSEVANFINNTLIVSLMSTQALLVTDSFTAQSKEELQAGKLPKPNSLWDFGGLVDDLLQ